MQKNLYFKLLRILSLQFFWLLFIMTSSSKLSFLAPLFATLIVIIDKKIFYPTLDKYLFLKNYFFILVIGIFIDSFLLNIEVISFRGWEYKLSPPFIWAIWILFIPYFQFAFGFFFKKPTLGSIVMFIGAPITYISASNISILQTTEFPKILILGLLWAVFFPFLLTLFKSHQNHN